MKASCALSAKDPSCAHDQELLELGVPHHSSFVHKYPALPLCPLTKCRFRVYLDILHEIATSGSMFKKQHALLTGVGKGSIGVEVLRGLLSGGADVVITASRHNRSTAEYYQGVFQRFGSKGSALTVVPFNQGSKQDVEALVDYIHLTLGLDLDYILPFAAVPENGREIDGFDDKSELAHRIMLVNLLRLLSAVKVKKASRHIITRPTQVVFPLFSNHGLFGDDGLYSESKIGLKTLFNRWSSESWENVCVSLALSLDGLAGLDSWMPRIWLHMRSRVMEFGRSLPRRWRSICWV